MNPLLYIATIITVIAILLSSVLFKIAWAAYCRYQKHRDSKPFRD